MIKMAGVRLENLTKMFGKKVAAVDHIDLEIKDKEFMVLLGPSGCGKTTTLRCIAGLETPTSGKIYIGDKVVNDIAEKDRDIAMVFQTFAIFPHMKVYDNISFPLRMRKVRTKDGRKRKLSKSEIKKAVQETAELLKISHLLDRVPGQLSGGEAQRVALGRAIVRNPQVFLLDEPLANLDAKLRVHMRVELKKLQQQLGVTTIYVTHDQAEAMTMADRVAVMHQGKIRQIGNAFDLYDRPADLFVAGFIGSPPMNFLDCTLEKDNFLVSDTFTLEIPKNLAKEIAKQTTSSELILGVRPGDIVLHEKEASNSIGAEIYATEPLGSETIVDLMLGNQIIKVSAPPTYKGVPGNKTWMTLNMDRICIMDKKTEKAIA